MNGQPIPSDAKAVAEFAARLAGQPASQPQGVHPVIAAQSWLGLSVPTLQAMKPNVVQCLCGKCQGVAVQFEGRMHFIANGGPEMIQRSDVGKPVAE